MRKVYLLTGLMALASLAYAENNSKLFININFIN